MLSMPQGTDPLDLSFVSRAWTMIATGPVHRSVNPKQGHKSCLRPIQTAIQEQGQKEVLLQHNSVEEKLWLCITKQRVFFLNVFEETRCILRKMFPYLKTLFPLQKKKLNMDLSKPYLVNFICLCSSFSIWIIPLVRYSIYQCSMLYDTVVFLQHVFNHASKIGKDLGPDSVTLRLMFYIVFFFFLKFPLIKIKNKQAAVFNLLQWLCDLFTLCPSTTPRKKSLSLVREDSLSSCWIRLQCNYISYLHEVYTGIYLRLPPGSK